MSLFAKIMVVLNFILAVVFLSAAGTYLNAMEDFKAKHTAEVSAHAETKSTLEQQVTAAENREREALGRAGEAEKAQAAAEAAQVSLTKSNENLQAESAQLRESVTKLGNTYEQAVANNTQLQAKIDQLNNDLRTAREDARSARDETNTTNTTNADLEQRVANLEKQLADAQAENTAASASIERLQTRIALYVDIYGAPPNVTAMADVQGRVQAADNEMDIYVLSVGSKDEVEVGYEFTVYRDSKYISTLVVNEVGDNYAACHTKAGMKKHDVKPGDSVATQL